MKRHVKPIGAALSAVLIIGLCGIFLGTEQKATAPPSAIDSNEGRLLADTPAVTQQDLEENFLHYAEEKATVTFPITLPDNAASENAHVVGVVLDYDTEACISDATIFANDQAVVVTGENGRFQLNNTPNGEYDWKVAATGYKDALYLNYSVDSSDGANIFTFHISQDRAISKDRDTIHTGEQSLPPSDLTFKLIF